MDEKKKQPAHAPADAHTTPKPKKTQPIRAINEDDDGYDPYSDLHDAPQREPLFERDPWR